MPKHYLIYGHSGSYNHGAEALTRTTIALLRRVSPGCKITLSTHFTEQDRKFGLAADEFVERDLNGGTHTEIYAPTIEKITADTVCLHIGGDNYCYKNWQRWAAIHYAALDRGAKSILWSCSIDPDMIDDEMLEALRTHHLIAAREGISYSCLLERGLTNAVKVSDIAFTLKPEPVEFELENFAAVNVSPLVIRLNPLVGQAYQRLIDYIIRETDMNVVLVPHVVQPVDNDYDALQSFDVYDTERVRLISDRLSAGQYKTIIGKSRFCIAARTHAVIAAYSVCVPALAVGYSSKANGIARDLGMADYVINVGDMKDSKVLLNGFTKMAENENLIRTQLEEQIKIYIQNVANEKVLEALNG